MKKEIIATILTILFFTVNSAAGLGIYVFYGLLLGWNFPVKALNDFLDLGQKWIDSKIESGKTTDEPEKPKDPAVDPVQLVPAEKECWGYYDNDFTDADKNLITELQNLGGKVAGSRKVLYCLKEGAPVTIGRVVERYFDEDEKRDIDIAFPNESLARAAAALVEKAAKDGVEVKVFSHYAKQPYNPAVYRKVMQTPSVKIDIFADKSFSLRKQWLSWAERNPDTLEEISRVAWEYKMKYGKEWQPPF